MLNSFGAIFKGRVVIAGIGNPLKGDDAFGPALIECLRGTIKAVCIDTGSTPENYLGRIAQEKPDTVLIVDAVHLGKRPGEYQILNRTEIAAAGFTTHDISPEMFMGYLEKETTAAIYLLGVQPEKLTFGQGLSAPLKQTLNEVSELIREVANA